MHDEQLAIGVVDSADGLLDIHAAKAVPCAKGYEDGVIAHLIDRRDPGLDMLE